MPKDEPTAVTQEALVEQCDREAAADRFDAIGTGHIAKRVRSGGYDNNELVQAFARHRLAAEAKASIVPEAGMVEVVARAICCEGYGCATERGTYSGKCEALEYWTAEATAAIHALSPYFDKARREGIERAAKVAENLDVSGYRMGHGQAEIATAILALPRYFDKARREGWQPIETAPKDGTRVLLWSGRWTGPACGIWVNAWTVGYDLPPFLHQPTHWMPLPSGPDDGAPLRVQDRP